jgi:hypothetical protein
MVVRTEVLDFVALGPLPSEEGDASAFAEHQGCLERIERPISDEEAVLLVRMFGPDDCYGAAWTLLHLIESAPSSPLKQRPSSSDDEWLTRLWDRAHRALLSSK